MNPKKLLVAVWLQLKLTLGFASVPEVCEASKGRAEYHDYPVSQGGTGHPDHFCEYTCWHCGKKFTI